MRNGNKLGDLVRNISTARVLAVGDIMLDRYVMGSVERISPEAPIPVLHVSGEKIMLGGAGNVAANICALGAGVDVIAAIGMDGPGEEIKRLLRNMTGANFRPATVEGMQTTIKTRFVAGTQQIMRADIETTGAIKNDDEKSIVRSLAGSVSNAGAIVISDYGKGVVSDAVIAELVKLATEKNIKVVVDPKGRDYSRYRGADIITPNKKELHEATSMPVGSDDEVIAAARHLLKTAGVKNVLATRSAEGMTLVTGDGSATHMKAEALDVFDVSGAGDTVCAVLALGLAAGADMAMAAMAANIAASIVVGKSGTATATANEMLHAIHHREVGRAEAKLHDLATARATTERWRQQGLKVGFTNGCFDLLHPGHVSLLAEARTMCDRLVVGLNSDSSVKKLKGDTRPIQGEDARADVLGALGAVDMVVIFSEETPINLIGELKPDVLVKGADYKIEEVVGREIVEGYGGEVKLAKILPGHSTTNTVGRMKDN